MVTFGNKAAFAASRRCSGSRPGATTQAPSRPASTTATGRTRRRTDTRTAAIARVSPASRMVAGAPRDATRETTTAPARPAPTRSAKYRRLIRSGARPNSDAVTTPTAMNDANTATEMTSSRMKFLKDSNVPYCQIAKVFSDVNATTT